MTLGRLLFGSTLLSTQLRCRLPLRSPNYGSPPALGSKRVNGGLSGLLGKGLLDWRLKTGYLFCIDNIISINERQKTSVTSQKGDGKGLL